jgi:16S rRNA (uracil1498-N3)-methyltransferase
MQLPFFYAPDLGLLDSIQSLAEDTARHIAQVLRMKEGDLIHLTDGKGRVATARIVSIGKKTCTVQLQVIENFPAPEHHCTIAVSLLKNAGRFEWLLEKAAELGINSIVPLICHRTERQQFRNDRWQNILVSAMLQSRQAWLTELATPINCIAYIGQCNQNEKYIAHCDAGEKTNFASVEKSGQKDSIVLIGPEGDFTPEEIQVAIAHGFKPISLGNTRLRTETAAIVAAVIQKTVISC